MFTINSFGNCHLKCYNLARCCACTYIYHVVKNSLLWLQPATGSSPLVYTCTVIKAYKISYLTSGMFQHTHTHTHAKHAHTAIGIYKVGYDMVSLKKTYPWQSKPPPGATNNNNTFSSWFFSFTLHFFCHGFAPDFSFFAVFSPTTCNWVLALTRWQRH